MSTYSAALLNDLDPLSLIDLVKTLDAGSVYDGLFIADERFYKNTYSQLTLAAEHSNRLQVGTGVTNPYTRHPAVTASAIASIDEISDGRAILGLGAGSPVALNPAGIEQEHPIRTVRNAARTVRRLHEGETVTLTDEAFVCNDLDLDIEQERTVPIYIAGRGPQILSLGGHIGDGVIAGAGLASVAGMEYAFERIDIGTERANHSIDDLDVICWAFLSVSTEREIAYNAVTPLIAEIVDAVPAPALEAIGVPTPDIERIKGVQGLKEQEPARLREIVSDDVIRQFAIAGIPEDCRAHIDRLHALGVEHIAVLPFENRSHGVAENLEAFAELAPV